MRTRHYAASKKEQRFAWKRWKALRVKNRWHPVQRQIMDASCSALSPSGESSFISVIPGEAGAIMSCRLVPSMGSAMCKRLSIGWLGDTEALACSCSFDAWLGAVQFQFVVVLRDINECRDYQPPYTRTTAGFISKAR